MIQMHLLEANSKIIQLSVSGCLLMQMFGCFREIKLLANIRIWKQAIKLFNYNDFCLPGRFHFLLKEALKTNGNITNIRNFP